MHEKTEGRTAGVNQPDCPKRPASAGIDLKKRRRVGQDLVQGFLFACGALSILTTIGIVAVLGRESLDFFTRRLWENANKPLASSIDEFDNALEVGSSGFRLHEGQFIRIDEEVMGIAAIDGTRLEVDRGLEATQPVPHDRGKVIWVGTRVSLVEFFTHTTWSPQIGEFGILPLATATLMTSAIAMLVALPLGLGVAIYLSEYASSRARNSLKPILEILAGVPTVVYGYFALTFMTPLMRAVFGKGLVQVYNTASAGIVVGILIIPLISSMGEDAFSAVPRTLRDAAHALGATKLETAVGVVVPAAFSGIMAAVILAVSRAVGETMIVTIAAGAGPNFTFNPFESAETMTGHIVRISGGDLSYDSSDYNSIFALGLVLFFMTLGLNIISQQVVKRYREVYE